MRHYVLKKVDILTITVVVHFSPPPRSLRDKTWTPALYWRRSRREKLGHPKLRGGTKVNDHGNVNYKDFKAQTTVEYCISF